MGFQRDHHPVAVNPRARQIDGERCLASVLDLPEPADLAVIAVPAPAVLDVAEQCGQRGVRSLVVITSGLDVAACADLLAVCRQHGMRLVGPNCFGVAVPGLGLDATFTASRPRPGGAGLMEERPARRKHRPLTARCAEAFASPPKAGACQVRAGRPRARQMAR